MLKMPMNKLTLQKKSNLNLN